jgi:hypothetical protein
MDAHARMRQRVAARQEALRRISTWTAVLATSSLVGTGAFAVAASAQSSAATTSTAATPTTDDGGASTSDQGGSLQPPQQAPQPGLQGGAQVRSSGS